MDNLQIHIQSICQKAKNASPSLALASTAQKNTLLCSIVHSIKQHEQLILEANETDIKKAESNGYPKAMIDRLTLTPGRIDSICRSIDDLIGLLDPIGSGERQVRPNGLIISCSRVPLGVVAIIYEARPNVTVDTTVLCLKTGNAIILRGGKEAFETNRTLVSVMQEALVECGFSPDLIGFIDDTSRDSATILMQCRDFVDVLIPRGGKGLISSCVEHSKIPIIETGAGNCHLFVDSSADLTMAETVAVNAKCQRPSVCNAIETLLVHESVAQDFLPRFVKATEAYHLEIRGCTRTCGIISSAIPAQDGDWDTEYDDYILAVKIVDSLDEAISHINAHSTHHSESILTNDYQHALRFQQMIDSACVYVNASTRFTDGGEFGFGAEVGISVQKLHARGPMGLSALTTTKYLIEGQGQIRQ